MRSYPSTHAFEPRTDGAAVPYAIVIAALFALVFSLLIGGMSLADTAGCLVPVAPFVGFWNRLRPGLAVMYLFAGIMLALCGLTAVAALTLNLPIIEITAAVGALAGISVPTLFDWQVPYTAAAAAAAQQLQQIQQDTPQPDLEENPSRALIAFAISGVLITACIHTKRRRRDRIS
ncbi:hypothetical protein BN2537_2643 [Streptomyces venezuelae]|nr:hypothetical protein BN2537_2643 [Streptomyces venezuelae]